MITENYFLKARISLKGESTDSQCNVIPRDVRSLCKTLGQSHRPRQRQVYTEQHYLFMSRIDLQMKSA